MPSALLAALLAAASAPAAAGDKPGQPAVSAPMEFSKTGYDELAFLGWNDSCSCAIQHLVYPPVGDDLQGIPRSWRIGTLTVEPGAREAADSWLYSSRAGGWEPERAAAAVEKLHLAGYTRRGYVEVVRPARAYPRPGLDQEIRSPDPLAKGQARAWPPARFRLRQVFYSPLAVCALVVFRDESSPRDSFRWRLIQLLDPGIRRQRARAHLENGLLLYDAADIYGGVEETGIAAAMMPDFAAARYHYARLLATHGRFDETLKELEAAIRLDPAHRAEARRALEFRSLAKDLRFKALVE